MMKKYIMKLLDFWFLKAIFDSIVKLMANRMWLTKNNRPEKEKVLNWPIRLKVTGSVYFIFLSLVSVRPITMMKWQEKVRRRRPVCRTTSCSGIWELKRVETKFDWQKNANRVEESFVCSSNERTSERIDFGAKHVSKVDLAWLGIGQKSNSV